MNNTLNGKKIAVLATDGYEESELVKPMLALKEAGATVHVVAPDAGSIRGWSGGDWGERVNVDVALDEAGADDYDSLVLPGGVMNPDKLRMNDKAVGFVRAFFAQGKPVSAICHGPQLLIEAGVVEGRTMTSYPSIRKDLINAGAEWIDESVVVDKGLTTSRTPDDLPDFIDKVIEETREGVHAGQTV